MKFYNKIQEITKQAKNKNQKAIDNFRARVIKNAKRDWKHKYKKDIKKAAKEGDAYIRYYIANHEYISLYLNTLTECAQAEGFRTSSGYYNYDCQYIKISWEI